MLGWQITMQHLFFNTLILIIKIVVWHQFLKEKLACGFHTACRVSCVPFASRWGHFDSRLCEHWLVIEFLSLRMVACKSSSTCSFNNLVPSISRHSGEMATTCSWTTSWGWWRRCAASSLCWNTWMRGSLLWSILLAKSLNQVITLHTCTCTRGVLMMLIISGDAECVTITMHSHQSTPKLILLL